MRAVGEAIASLGEALVFIASLLAMIMIGTVIVFAVGFAGIVGTMAHVIIAWWRRP